MVVIAGDVPSHYFGKHPHQEINLHADAAQWEIYRPFVKRAWRVDQPHLIAEVLDKAFTLAESGRPGPVLVDVPMDVFSAEIDVALFDKVLSNTRSLAKPSLDEEVAERIIRNLLGGGQAVLYVGGGIVAADAAAELKEFAELLSLPVAHSLMGKGALADDSPLVLGMTGFWGTAFVNETTRTADWILALGTRFPRKPTRARGTPSTPSTFLPRSSCRSTSTPPSWGATTPSRSARSRISSPR